MDYFACAAFANLGEIDNRNRGVFDTLAAVRLGNLGVAAPQYHDVLFPYQRTPTLEVGHNARTAAGGERKFHRCRLTIRLRLRLIEIGVTIEKQQPVAAAPPKGEQAAEHDRAITAENDRELPRFNDAFDHVCECHRIVGNAPRVEKHCFRVAAMVMLRRLNAPRALSLQSLGKTLGQQSIWERLAAFVEQAEDGRSFDDSEVRTGYGCSSCLRRNNLSPFFHNPDSKMSAIADGFCRAISAKRLPIWLVGGRPAGSHIERTRPYRRSSSYEQIKFDHRSKRTVGHNRRPRCRYRTEPRLGVLRSFAIEWLRLAAWPHCHC